MREKTIVALNRINRRFYSSHAVEFSSTRSHPWPGWQRLLPFLWKLQTDRGKKTTRILDVGCGNGRLQRFLRDELEGELSYCGIDSSEELLREAETRSPDRSQCPSEWLAIDLTCADPLVVLGRQRFDLIAVFALLHHIPSFELRRNLLGALVERLAPGGLLALSHWQLGEANRFEHRLLSWQEHNRGESNVDTTDLESGDVLLRWGADDGGSTDSSYRYCHWVDLDEAQRLVAGLGLGLEEITTFRADGQSGDLNLYFCYQPIR